jgi:hypothetical protein
VALQKKSNINDRYSRLLVSYISVQLTFLTLHTEFSIIIDGSYTLTFFALPLAVFKLQRSEDRPEAFSAARRRCRQADRVLHQI